MLVAVFLLASVVEAQEAKKAPPQSVPSEKELVFSAARPQAGDAGSAISTFGIWDFLRMLLILGFVLALVYGFFHYLKKLASPRETGLEMIRLLESRVLSGNKHLHLVEVGDHIVLIGTSESSIQLLLELKDRETIDSIRLKVSELPSPRKTKGFFDLVQQYFHRKEAGEQAGGIDASGEESLEFIRRQRERLNKLH